jgi:hypothetical protein
VAVIDGAFVIVAGPLAFPWPVTDLAFTESESPQEKAAAAFVRSSLLVPGLHAFEIPEAQAFNPLRVAQSSMRIGSSRDLYSLR